MVSREASWVLVGIEEEGAMGPTRKVVLITIGGIVVVLAIFLVIILIEGDSSPDRNGPTPGGAPVLAR